MFRRFHAMRMERDERGFTLIELLVVILIIAILAAIAIPVFLRQREKGWVAQVESALKNATTAEESYSTGDGDGLYTDDLTLLEGEGFRYAADVTPVPQIGGTPVGTIYCVSATHAKLGATTYAISSDETTPQLGSCTGGAFVAP